LVRSFRVGKRTCTWTFARPVHGGVVHSAVEWVPDVPRRLSKKEWRQYRSGRDAAVAELSRLTGLTVMVAEL
jgi:hypothetical protein